uniref:RING-type E3 ubiquitin transferase n=1 Tax=Chenopodium quinoa TaxID=63459 RepID=A0A803M7Q9_CHEQI
MAVAILLISYYIFVIKCCLNWQNLDPLRRFSISRTPRNDQGSIISFSPMMDGFHHRGLDEFLINNIPAIQYKSHISNDRGLALGTSKSFRGCAVCLNEFEEKGMLRVLPRCNHTFHLDCIDVWLLNNASCPLCRSSISGRTKYPLDHIIAPSSSPQEVLSPLFSGNLRMVNFNGDDQDFLVIEVGDDQDIEGVATQTQKKTEHNNKKLARKLHNLSIMGDECINSRHKDEQFAVQQPIRRSFSMDSVADRGLILQVQEIVRQNQRQLYDNNNEVSSRHYEECNNVGSNNGRVRRSSFFSFGHGRGSRSSSILPIECDRL